MGIVLASAIAAFCLVPHEDALVDHVDLIELAHVYDGDGRKVLSQVIFWNWHWRDSKFHVCDWRIANAKSMRPRLDHRSGEYRLEWRDGNSGAWRRAIAPSFRETWSQYDPEVADRAELAVDFRRKLTPPPARKPKPAVLVPVD